MTALPSHFYLSVIQTEMDPTWVQIWLALGTIAAIATAALATYVPMLIGLCASGGSEL